MLIEDKRYEPSVRDDQGYSEHEMGEMREKKKREVLGFKRKQGRWMAASEMAL